MCYAQIGGLSAATVVTLLLVPVMYSICVLDLKIIRWEPAVRYTQKLRHWRLQDEKTLHSTGPACGRYRLAYVLRSAARLRERRSDASRRNADALNPVKQIDLAHDFFKDMDRGVALQNPTEVNAQYVAPLDWRNDRFWDLSATLSFGNVDLLKSISSYDRIKIPMSIAPPKRS